MHMSSGTRRARSAARLVTIPFSLVTEPLGSYALPRVTPTRLALAGIATASLLLALTTGLLLLNHDTVGTVYFWLAGGDHMILDLTDLTGGESGPRTIVLVAALPDSTESIEEDFEETEGSLAAL